MPTDRITGGFFDLTHVNIWDAAWWTDQCRFWKEENWKALIADMHGVGMDTAICITTALWGRPHFPGYEKTVGKQLLMGCPDPLRACVDEAERLGMKMMYGLGLRGRCSQVRDYAHMQPPWPDVWFEWNQALAEAIMEMYSDRPSFAGVYIPYEIDFAIDNGYMIDLYEKLIKQYLRPVIGADTPIMISPGSLGNHGDSSMLASQIERTDVNILAPQDYGGRTDQGVDPLEFVRSNAEVLAGIREQTDRAGVTLWCNCEVFNLDPNPDGRVVCMPGDIERIKEQIELAGPLVDKLICYQYQGIMNRKTDLVQIGAPGTQKLYDGYMEYIRQLDAK